MAPQSAKKGDDIYVFYRMTKRCQQNRKYMAVLDPRHGAYRPRTGLSDGWVPARVTAVRDGGVSVEYSWPHFFTQRGQLTDANDHWEEWFKLSDVRSPSEFGAAAASAKRNSKGLPLVPPGSQPDLSIITFRWGGINEIVAPTQWGTTGSSVSDTFVDSIIDRGIIPRLGNSYEVWTVYVESATDLAKIADSAHLIFGPSHPARRAKTTCAMYFLYPTSFEEGCEPTRETGEDHGAAYVDQKSFFRCMQAMERASIPTRFPHSSGFYELLASKRWTSLMCLTPHLRVPPTVAVPRMLIDSNYEEAAARAYIALRDVRLRRAALAGEEIPEETCKGVAKLGFSWEALDVKFWEGEDGLKEALFQLTQSIEISRELTGQPHDLETIIVQDYCKHDLEMRLYVVEGKVETVIYTKFLSLKENNEFGDFEERFTFNEAANEWMGGDAEALRHGEQQCRRIVREWLAWARTQVVDMPPAIRYDFFVGRKTRPGSGGAYEPGKAVVWTLEICEIGFSMLGAEDLPNKVFAALVRNCLGDSIPLDTLRAVAQEERDAMVVGSQLVTDKDGDGAGKAKPDRDLMARIHQLEEQLREAGLEPNHGLDQFSPPARQKLDAKSPVEAPTPERMTRSKDASVASSSAAGAAAAEPTPSASSHSVLYINVPRNNQYTEDQTLCTGRYLIENYLVRGMPLWMHERGDRWLYLGTDLAWYVGDEEEKEKDFECQQGYIRYEVDFDGDEARRLPFDLPYPWQRGPEWEIDYSITVSLRPDAPPVTPIEGGQRKSNKGKGKPRRK